MLKIFGFISGLLLALSLQAATFTYQPLAKDWQRALQKAEYWHKNCPVPLDRLSLLTLSYYDFEGKERIGQIVVLDAMAAEVVAAFKELYQRRFPLEAPQVISPGDQDATTGLTVAFNCRALTGGGVTSLHSYGAAIDINVAHNPYLGSYRSLADGKWVGRLIPPTGLSYLNRRVQRPGMNEAIVDIMQRHGLSTWGGAWLDTIDYMHFQISRNIAQHLAALPTSEAEKLYALTIRYPKSAVNLSADSRWFYLYKLYPQRYMDVFSKYFPQLSSTKESEVFTQISQTLANG